MTGPVTPPKAAPPALIAERKYLAERFAGTPVTIEMDPDGALVIDVPLAFAFDAGKDTPKPALTKVLDYVGTSLRRVLSTRFVTSAPGDATKPAAGLAERRAKAVSQYIVTRGVNALRATGANPSEDTFVRVRIAPDKPAP